MLGPVSTADDDRDDVVLDPSLIVGTWANATRVHLGRDEITIDFRRRVPDTADPFRVARMLMPPLAAVELRDQLDELWWGYTNWPAEDV
jgi:hypothetical protein